MKLAFIGDNHAIPAESVIQYFGDYSFCGVTSLPVWDVECQRLLSDFSHCNKIFWSCGSEFNGCDRFENIKNLLAGQYTKCKQEEMYWYANRKFEQVTEESRAILFYLFLNQIEFCLNQNPNIILVPIATRLLNKLPGYLKTPGTYRELRARFGDRCLNLDNFFAEEDNFEGENFQVTPKGYLVLKQMFDRF